MMLPKPIKEWYNIFLDTSVIIDYVSNPEIYKKNLPQKERIELVHRLMNKLLSPASDKNDKKKRCIYLSAVSIGELHRMDSQKQNVIELIITLFSASDVTIIGYTKDVALLLNKSFRDFLPEEKGKEFLSHLKKELNAVNFKNSRQWIDDDMKICACAKSLSKLDVVLTTDRNTFKPFADKMELPCVTVYPESFPKDIFGSIDNISLQN